MPTHAEISGKLLSDAANFFMTLAEQNPDIQKEMTENATVFQQMSQLISQDPEGKIDDKSHGELAGRLLIDAATFFKTLASQNEPIKEQMEENARVFEQVSTLVTQNPTGEME